MARSDDLKNEKYRYEECLRWAIDTCNAMVDAINKLGSIASRQSYTYKVDDVSKGGNYLNDLLESEKRIYFNLKDNVIPGTRSKIDELNYWIDDAVQQEAMEAEAAE